jgi:hypothetical protein
LTAISIVPPPGPTSRAVRLLAEDAVDLPVRRFERVAYERPPLMIGA